MADPNQLSRQERRLVDQIHLAKLAIEQRLIPRRMGHWARSLPARPAAANGLGPQRRPVEHRHADDAVARGAAIAKGRDRRRDADPLG